MDRDGAMETVRPIFIVTPTLLIKVQPGFPLLSSRCSNLDDDPYESRDVVLRAYAPSSRIKRTVVREERNRMEGPLSGKKFGTG